MPKSIFWPVCFAIFALLFYPLLTTYFSMDDFFHFTVFPVDEPWGEFFKIFGIYKFDQRGIAFYRPISRELPFFIFYHIFGFNSLPYRLLQIFIHLVNTFLIYKLVYKLTQNRVVAQLTSLFVLISSINIAVLYYLAGGIQSSLMTTFLLSTCLAYLNKKIFLTYIFNLLALMSFETAVAIPFLLLGITILMKKKSYRQLIPSFAFSILFFLINYFYIGFSSAETQYSLNLSPIRALNTFIWYILWSFGLPEMLIDFIGPGLHLNPNLMEFWSRYFVIIFPTFFALLVLFAYSALKNLRKFTNKQLKIISFLVLNFIALLGPFLLLPNHKSTHYLAPALPFFWTAVTYVIYRSIKNNKHKKHYLAIFVFLVLLLNATSIKLGEKTYWAVQRGNIAKKVLTQLKSGHPTLPAGTTLYIKNDPNYPKLKGDWGGSSTQVSHILSGDDAVRLLYNDNSIQVLYEDLHPQPQSDNLVNFTAKLK